MKAATPASFKKGQSGNPKGRPPKGYSISDWFKHMLASTPEVKDKIGKSILAKALDGDTTAQKLIWNYMDGMPQQDITSGGETITGPTVFIPKEEEA